MTSRLELHHEGQIIVVQADDAVLGRRSDCELRVIHPLVSRQHCRFEVRTNGVTLVDLGSANGTFVNGERLSGSTLLRANDWVRVGTQGPQFQLLRAEVDGEDVSGWDPEAMQETMVGGAPPVSSDFTVRVSVGPQARAEPDAAGEGSTPSALAGAPGKPPSIPVASPLDTNSTDIRSSDVVWAAPSSGVHDELGPVLIGPGEGYPPSDEANAPAWADASNEYAEVDPDVVSEEYPELEPEEETNEASTRAAGPRDLATLAGPPDARDHETGVFEDETAAARSSPPAPQPKPKARPEPPAAHDPTAKPANWPAAAPASEAVRAAAAGASRHERRWGAQCAGFLVGLLLALVCVALAAAFTPLDEKLHELAPGMRVIQLPEEWR